MTFLWIDASAGASGDMLLAALIDAGASIEAVQEAVDSLGIAESVELGTHDVTRCGFRAGRLNLGISESFTRRSLTEITRLVSGRALEVFNRLAQAEARAHGVAFDQVHFHEVGAVDCLVDVVGTVAALDDLGVTSIGCSAIAVGHGSVATEHGRMPIPVPAVAGLLGEVGAPMVGGAIEHEACTPTAAALLATLVSDWGPLPELNVRSLGIGAGQRDPQEAPNVVRVLLGERIVSSGTVPRIELECNVDDLDPRIWPYVLNLLLKSGADDAWLAPITMKKNREAFTLHVLLAPALLPALSDIVIRETSTIGYRVRTVFKAELARQIVTVDVDAHPVRVKIASADGEVVNVCAEFEDAAEVAAKTGKPLVSILREAVALARGATELTAAS